MYMHNVSSCHMCMLVSACTKCTRTIYAETWQKRDRTLRIRRPFSLSFSAIFCWSISCTTMNKSENAWAHSIWTWDENCSAHWNIKSGTSKLLEKFTKLKWNNRPSDFTHAELFSCRPLRRCRLSLILHLTRSSVSLLLSMNALKLDDDDVERPLSPCLIWVSMVIFIAFFPFYSIYVPCEQKSVISFSANHYAGCILCLIVTWLLLLLPLPFHFSCHGFSAIITK